MIRHEMPSGRPAHYNTRYKHDLSPRERDVLALISKGKTNGEIAESLGLAFDTVKWHVSTILGKLGVDSREEASLYWHEYNAVGARLVRALSAFGGLLFGKPAAIAAATIGVAAVGAVSVAVLLNSTGNNDELNTTPQEVDAAADLPAPPSRISDPVRISSGPEPSSDLFTTDTSVWYQRLRDGLYRQDRATGTVEQVMAAQSSWTHGVAIANGVVWTVAADASGVRGFDAETGVQRYAYPFAFQGGPSDTWLGATADKVFVTLREAGILFRIDIATGRTDGLTQMTAPKGMVVAGGYLWAVASQNDEVEQIDLETMEIVRAIHLPLERFHSNCGSCLQHVFASDDSLWTVSNADEGGRTLMQLGRIDLKTGEVLGTWPFPGQAAGGVGLDSQGDAWVATRPEGESHAKLVHISASTNQVVETIALDLGRSQFELLTPAAVYADGDDIVVFFDEGLTVKVKRTP
ncbi:MAG: LuxR C-terminal-related transcriptional regulator [Dehalococcoidia bacterium]